MTRSVSTFWRIRGAATPVTLVNFSIPLSPHALPDRARPARLMSARDARGPQDLKLPDVGNRALDRRCRGHRRAGEMGAGAGPLPADEVAVRRRDAPLSRRHALAV